MVVVRIDGSRIVDEASFHDVFAEAFGFPDFYGRNMDAWIDCMSSLDAPSSGLTAVHIPQGGVAVVQVDAVDALVSRRRDLYDALVECAAFVNWRRLERGEPAVLALSFYRS